MTKVVYWQLFLVATLELPSMVIAVCVWTQHSQMQTSPGLTNFPDGSSWKDSPDGTLEASLAVAQEGCIALRANGEDKCKSLMCVTDESVTSFGRCYLRKADMLSPSTHYSTWIPESSEQCIGTTTTTTPLVGEYYKIITNGRCGDLSNWGYSTLSSYQCAKASSWFNIPNPIYEITQFMCQSTGGCQWDKLPRGCYFDRYRIVSTKYVGGFSWDSAGGTNLICKLTTCANYTCPTGMQIRAGADLLIHPDQDKCCKAKSYDCSAPPESMNGPSHPAGCFGAVWSNGFSSQSYCEGKQGAYEAYPWWSACCQWVGEVCTAKPGTATLVSTTTQFQDCTSVPPSMNGDLFPSGCTGAVWSNGMPSESYCWGSHGKYPWWSACCHWDGSGCTENEGTAVGKTTTTQFQDCGVTQQSMNGASFQSGCPGAVWTSGEPSKSYCEGKGGVYPWWAACCRWEESSEACVPKQVPGDRRLALGASKSRVVMV